MVRPFQILIVAGVGHAVLNGLGEFLSGTGNVAFRARTSVAWAIGMVTALAVLTAVDGIRGAAVAHLVLFVPLVIAYFGRGLRRVGLDPAAALGALRGILVAVSVQAVATAGVFVALDRTGAPNALAAGAASVAGLVLAAATAAIVDASLWSEARAALAAGVRRRRVG